VFVKIKLAATGFSTSAGGAAEVSQAQTPKAVQRLELIRNGPALKGHVLPPFQGWLTILVIIQGRPR